MCRSRACARAGSPISAHVSVPEAGEAPRPPIDVAPGEIRDFAYSMIRVLDDNGEAVGDWAGELSLRAAAQGPARHDADPRLRRAHAALAAPGQDLVLHHVARRGGGRLRPPQGALGGRHVLSDLPPAGTADRLRLAARRHDVLDLLQREGSPEGAPASRPLFGEGGGLLHRVRQPRHAVPAGRRLGDGLRHPRATTRSPRAGSATARPPRPTSTRRWCSPPSTGRRSS